MFVGICMLAALGLVAVAAPLGKKRQVAYERAALVPLGILVVQGLLGVILRIDGRRPSGLHVFYGVAAFAVFAAGTALARALQRDRWVVIAWASGIAALLSLRALMTG
jgi:hypothetical protein